MYRMVQSRLCWFRTFTDSIKRVVLKQSHADSCVFRRFINDDIETVIVVGINDMLLLASKTNNEEERTVCILGLCFMMKDLGKAEV